LKIPDAFTVFSTVRKIDDMPLSIVDGERNGVHSGEAAHDKQEGGGTAEGKGACFLGWQRAGT
jgi:hypothetical protein